MPSQTGLVVVGSGASGRAPNPVKVDDKTLLKEPHHAPPNPRFARKSDLAALSKHLITICHLSTLISRHRNLLAVGKHGPDTFTLDDIYSMEALDSLVERYSRVSHMVILDKSYTFFLSRARDAALYFKVKDKVAVVGGDPLCGPDLFPPFLKNSPSTEKGANGELHSWEPARNFTKYAKDQRWISMHFGMERVLNPLTNPSSSWNVLVVLASGSQYRTDPCSTRQKVA